MLFDSYVISGVSIYAAPNSCKKLTKRRMFARAASAALEQSTLDRRHAARTAILQYGASGVPRSASPCEAVLQFMRQSLGGRAGDISHAYSSETVVARVLVRRNVLWLNNDVPSIIPAEEIRMIGRHGRTERRKS